MNDTPQGDGNFKIKYFHLKYTTIRMNDTPQGDGNSYSTLFLTRCFTYA